MTNNHGPYCHCSKCDANTAVNLLAELQAGTTPERAAQIAEQADEIAGRSPNRLAVNEDADGREVEFDTGWTADRMAPGHYAMGTGTA